MAMAMAIVCFLTGCTSLHTIELSPDDLHQQIRAGQIITTGERIRLVTSDEEQHNFLVTGIDQTAVHGEESSVPIDDIVAVKTERFSLGKTALLAGGTTATVAILIAIMVAVAPAAILAASGP
jgi:hypothetical protein